MIREITVVRTCWLFIFFCWPPLFMVCSNMFFSCTWKKNGMLNWYSLTYKEVGFLLPSRKGFAALRIAETTKATVIFSSFPVCPRCFLSAASCLSIFSKNLYLSAANPWIWSKIPKWSLKGQVRILVTAFSLVVLIFFFPGMTIYAPSFFVYKAHMIFVNPPVCLPKFSDERAKLILYLSVFPSFLTRRAKLI